MLRYDLNLPGDISAVKFLHYLFTQHKISGLELKGLTPSIKSIGLGLIYTVLYSCLDMTRPKFNTQTQIATLNEALTMIFDNFGKLVIPVTLYFSSNFRYICICGSVRTDLRF